jgi:phosphatidylserine/phosphatidylglycerophosphate/cardiolipin synthase-like enzyme
MVLGCILSLLTVVGVPSSPAPADFELVLSAPVETTLERSDLRSPRQVWPELIDSATARIDLAEFYVANEEGESLVPVLDALKRAGERGVRIRMLLEKKMESSSKSAFDALKAIPHLELRIIDLSRMSPDGILHAKYFVVDGRRAYLGSQNFDWRSLTHIHELGARIADAKIASQLQAIFEVDWRAAELIASNQSVAPLRRDRASAESDARAYLVASPYAFDPPGVGDSESELVRLIGSAKETIKVELLQYCPLDHKKREYYAPIDVALRTAAARGVKVMMLVSDWNAEQPCIRHVQSLSLLPNVEIRMVSIPDAKRGFIPFARVIHAKYMVVDHTALWLGTSNWTGGYLDRSRNVELVSKDAKLLEQALSIHAQLWDSAYVRPITASQSYDAPRKHSP